MKRLYVLVVCSIICVSGFAQEADSEIGVPADVPLSSTLPPAVAAVLAENGAGIEQAVRDGNISYLYDFLIQAGPGDKYTGNPQNKTIQKFINQAFTVRQGYTIHDKRTDMYRTGKMYPQVREVPSDMMTQVFTSPEPVLPQVVAALLNRSSNDFDKVKVMHDWICDNIAYDYQMFSSGKTENQDYISVLKKKKAVCSGYSNLLRKMCEIAEIEALVINGSLKSKDYGWTGKVPSGDHAWNSVRIGNKWYLVDATLDAGYVANMKAFVKRYSTEYLFLDSRPFLYTHFPENPELQYYGPAISAETFEQEITVPGIFFQYGLSFDKDTPLEVTPATNGVYSFYLNHSKLNVNVQTKISAGEAISTNRNEQGLKTTIIGYILPEPPSGDYDCIVTAQYIDEENWGREVEAAVFEDDWMKMVRDFRTEDQITAYEMLIFKGAYFKVASTNKYYFEEDLFDTNKNSIVKKVLRLLQQPFNLPRTVLTFSIKGKDTN
ncbi:hypothetical protein AGMMS49991_10260 [Spirochaetia bacterium]|nr:hypothetical protein AGMMS49991_10260 [Spirochaetia bacterium]